MGDSDPDIELFKEIYYTVPGGKYNLEAQVPHLEKLAHRYDKKYQETGDWRDCLKVRYFLNSSQCDLGCYMIHNSRSGKNFDT